MKIWTENSAEMEGVCESCRDIERWSLQLRPQKASQSGHEKCVKTLIEAGADVNWIDQDTKNTALIHAAREGHENYLRLLVDAGTDVNLAVEKNSDEEETEDANTPLMLAAGNGHVNCVRMLIEAGADVTAIHGAVHCGNEACLDLLVKAGADVNMYHNKVYHESHGRPLQMICREGKHPHLVKALLNAGANMEKFEQPHKKPLLLAALSGHFQFIDALIQAGADVNSRGFNDITSLMYAASTPEIESDQTNTVNNRMCLDLLIKAGADVNMVERLGFSALMYAASNDNCYALKYLLQAGANVNMRSERTGVATLIAHLHLATATRLRCRCDIAPEWLTKRFPSDCLLQSQTLGVTVQHQNNRLDLEVMSQRRRSR